MMNMTKNILLAALLVMALAGCSSEADTSAGVSSADAEQAEVAPLVVNELDAAGMEKILAENKGKAVFICFWSVTCPACDKEIPELEKLAAEYGADELKLMLVNVDPTASNIARYFDDFRPISELYHGSNDLAEAYGVYRIPHLVLYDTSGEKFLDQSGFFPSKMLESLVEHALGKSSGMMGAKDAS